MTTAARRPLTQATGLIAHAEEHGWAVRETWTPPGYRGPQTLHVVIARRVSRESVMAFRLSWAADGTKPQKWQAITPQNARWHKAPSVTGIRSRIAAHPVRKADSS